MPDITMCKALYCRKRATCYRHQDSGTMPNLERQSYFMGEPCSTDFEYYYPISTIPTERITRNVKPDAQTSPQD